MPSRVAQSNGDNVQSFDVILRHSRSGRNDAMKSGDDDAKGCAMVNLGATHFAQRRMGVENTRPC